MSPVCWNARWSITYLLPVLRLWGLRSDEKKTAAEKMANVGRAPRFGADDEHAARGALYALRRVPYVLLTQLSYVIVLVFYALAHVHRLEDRHSFFFGACRSFSFFLWLLSRCRKTGVIF